MKLRIAAVALALTACLAKSKTVTLPNGLPALRIECNYEFANCERKARQLCDGHYERIGEGDLSCRDCGMEWNSQSNTWAPNQDPTAAANNEGNNVYTGTLYVRCK